MWKDGSFVSSLSLPYHNPLCSQVLITDGFLPTRFSVFSAAPVHESNAKARENSLDSYGLPRLLFHQRFLVPPPRHIIHHVHASGEKLCMFNITFLNTNLSDPLQGCE